jgi:pimeloyl-ACP methyl ester carboxylesterase/GNAT superfamily N-acetyltransferase
MRSDLAPEPWIRRAHRADAVGVGDVWLGSWRATFDFEPAHPDDDVRRWLADELIPRSEVWLAEEANGRIVAVMALSESMVEQLYIAPDRTGRGLGTRLLGLAQARRPAGLDLFCFQVNTQARSFYEHRGFVAVGYGDGKDNDERQPDVRYRWRPTSAPDLIIPSKDGTPIAAYRSGNRDGPPLVLVHGASADHTTFRVIGPLLGEAFEVIALDRRGRGASGDLPPYAIKREFEDVAAVAEAVARDRDRDAVDVFGHSYGGRCALGAALSSNAVGRVISYEGAPAAPGEDYGDAALAEELVVLATDGRNEELLATFMTRVVGMTADDLAAYRADPVWPRRVAAAGSIARELAAEVAADAGLDRLASVRQPVLQLLGGDSIMAFASATRALDDRLRDGRVVVIEGARHGGHHTHPDAVVAAVRSFLLHPV